MQLGIKPVRWGVMSSASIAVNGIIPAILGSSNAQLVAIGSRRLQHVPDLLTHAPGVHVYDNYESVLEDSLIEAVYIPLPNSLHAEWAIKALNAGKHVLCEKPLAITAEQGASMIRAAHANHVLLMEAFMYRFHPQTLWVLEQVTSGRIGKIKLVRLSFSFDIRSRPHDIRLQPTLGGGSLMDVGCYLVNYCRALYGSAPRSVAARAYVPSKGEVERAVNAILDYGEGAFAQLDTNFELPLRQKAEIIGEIGSITLPLPFPPKNVETIAALELNGQTIHERFPAVDHYRLEVEHFASCLRFGEQPALSVEETLENLTTMDAIYQAAEYSWPII
jgi:D-xylose 1-dehydrogenase (NADP+, D-xylono-1,5-lactone-forming)